MILRGLLFALIFAVLTVPISYAFMKDADATLMHEHWVQVHQAFKQAEHFAVEGTAWMTTVEVKTQTMRLCVAPRDEGGVKVLSMERDGKPIPIPPKFIPPMPQRWMRQFLRDAKIAEKNYRLTLEGEEPVAGRPCLKFVMTGRHGARPTNTLWIDRERHLILRREMIGPLGKRRMEAGFEQVVIREREKPFKPGKREPPRSPGGPIAMSDEKPSLEEATKLLASNIAEMQSLPNGFQRKRLDAIFLYPPVPDRKAPAIVANYTDGVEAFMVMQMKTSDLKLIEEDAKAHKDQQMWQAMRHGGGEFPRDLIRGSKARVEIGDTTLIAGGSIAQDEIKFLVSHFLKD